MPDRTSLQFPSQKLSRAKKTQKWAEDCVKAGEDLAIFRYSGIRESYRNKLTNYNLANDILDTADIESVCNPMGIKEATFPAKMQNYPIANPKIDLLVGEERKRKFNWKVRIINADAISEKEEEQKKQLFELMASKITAENFDKQEVEKELKELQKYHLYSYQDLREITATQILEYLYKVNYLKEEFARGFEDALIAGEEIYSIDIISGEPVLKKCNPLNIHTVRSGESPFIEDADIIVEDGYYSPGKVIDMFYDELTQEQVRKIDQGTSSRENENSFIKIGETEPSILIDGIIDTQHMTAMRTFGEFWDMEGNIRVIRVVWKSFKKVGKLSYFDEEGMPQETLVSEEYKVNKEAGEKIKWMWINEWWEGTRIGEGIFVKCQPRPLQFRTMANPSKCEPGYVGIAYNINSSKAKSLMDRMKPYQYLYNVFMYRTELAFAKAKGRIASLDLAQVPDHWDVDKWMYYAEVMGWAVKDSFKEAKKGAAQGKLAGQMQAQTPVIDLEMGNYIQQHIMMLQFLENQLGEIAGVTKQRQGQIENRELVGNVERAVTQSSHITEKWFALHDNVKIKALNILLDTAKLAWRNETDKRYQYVLDDMSTMTLKFSGTEFRESDYGVMGLDNSSNAELLNAMKQLAHAGLQNDKINFSQMMDIYLTPSIASVRKKIETAEAEKQQADQQQQQQAQKMQQEQLQAAQQQQQEAQNFEMAKIDKEYSYKIEIEKMKATSKFAEKGIDMDRDGIPDVLEVEKVESQERMKEKEIASREKIEDKKLAATEKKIAADKEIERQKLKDKEKDRRTQVKLEKIKSKNKPQPVKSK
jgi:hypothetical protein